ncbi:MAG: TldD/PmbA family protein [Thermoplasmata archaeon]|nr:TldD/PmbA family protein [Thermoplasmata archaeon]
MSGDEARSLRLLADTLAALPPGADADARLTGGEWGTMRFANGRIHQPHLEHSRLLSLRVASDLRLGTATTTDLTPEGVKEVVRQALAIAAISPVERKFPGFPAGSKNPKPVAFSEATARLTPEAQGRIAAAALNAAHAAIPDSRVSGVVNAGQEFIAVANTSGLSRFSRRSVIQSSVLVERPTADPPVSGWSEGAHWDARELDAAALGREAASRVATTAPASVKPGKYRVLLGGSAASELIGYLGYLGFNGHGEEEGWSCLAKKRGRRTLPESMTIIDEGRSPYSIPQAIDYEGVEKRRTPLIESGVARAAVTDLVTAGRLGVSTSGHGLPPESPFGEWGPIPTQVRLLGGDAREEEMIRETRRGILVTRFHYVRVVHPGQSILTGMTRDGTYQIEKGEVTRPLRNLRFTESILASLGKAEMWGRAGRRYSDERGGATVTSPSLLTGAFRFTSSTLF